MRHILLCLVLCCSLSIPASAADAGMPLGIRYTKAHPLVVVADWIFQPYTFRNDKGEADGLLIEMVEEIFSQLHVPYEIRMTDYKNAKRMLYSGEAQLMMDVKKPDEIHGVRYGKAELINYRVGVVRLNTTRSLHSIELIKSGDTIYTNTWNYIDRYLLRYFNNAPVFTVSWRDPHDALDDILHGKIKYYICGKAGIENDIKMFSLRDKITVDDIDIPEGHFHFLSSDAALLDELDMQFDRLKKSGRYQPLVNKWLSGNDNYDEGNALLDIIAIVGIILLFVGATIALVFTMRGGNTGNLKREFRAVAHMSITLTDCNVFAINVRRQWVYNVSGDFLPRRGLSMKDYEKLIHPDDLYIEQDACRRVDAGERNMPLISFRMRKHNAAPDEWRQMRVDASIKSDKKGMPIYVYLAMHDETDRLEEQRLLDMQLREFSHITEITDFGMAYYDAKGKLANCNNAMIQIFDKGGVGKGEKYLRSTTRDDLKIIFNGLMLGQGQRTWLCCPVDIPELNLHVTLELRINPVRSDDGKYQGFSVCALDLTEKLDMYHRDSAAVRREQHNGRDLHRYRVEEEYVMRERDALNNKFQQVQQMLKEQTKLATDAAKQKTLFLANMTHELRTPLNLINGFAEVMQVGATKEEKQQYFAIMQHNCTMLIHIIDNILRLSNIETDGITVKPHLIDFAKEFMKTADEMEKYMALTKVEYAVESPLSTLDVEVDYEKIKVILDAFVNNAVKNTNEGSIRVGFAYQKNEHLLSIYCQDTGCGIPQDKKEEIFECFKKVNAFVPGTGIGLYICKRIADAMNATIEVESTEGKGSTFTLNIPLK